MVNRVGKVPKDKLCVQEIGLRNDQVPLFLKLICEFLKMMLPVEAQEATNFGNNREAIWQNASAGPASSLVSIALSQPQVNSHVVMTHLQLTTSLLLMSGLGIKLQKVFTHLFDNLVSGLFFSICTHSFPHIFNLDLFYLYRNLPTSPSLETFNQDSRTFKIVLLNKQGNSFY